MKKERKQEKIGGKREKQENKVEEYNRKQENLFYTICSNPFQGEAKTPSMNRNMSELLIKKVYQHVTKKNKPSKNVIVRNMKERKNLKDNKE